MIKTVSDAPAVITTTDAQLFVVHFNRTKLRGNKPDKYAWENIAGTRYGNGWVTLENGTNFHMMSDLEFMLEQTGEYRVDWIR